MKQGSLSWLYTALLVAILLAIHDVSSGKNETKVQYYLLTGITIYSARGCWLLYENHRRDGLLISMLTFAVQSTAILGNSCED